MGPLLEIWVDGEAVITLLSKCLNVTASIVYFSVSCKTLADGSFSFPVKSVSLCLLVATCKHMSVWVYFFSIFLTTTDNNNVMISHNTILFPGNVLM